MNFLERKNECDERIENDETLKLFDYASKNYFNNLFSREGFKKELEQQKTMIKAKNELAKGIATFDLSFENENYVQDIVWDSIDMINNAMKTALEKDLETEALCSFYLGKIFYRALKMSEKAKMHYNDCIRILETLKPRIFTHNSWHQLMMKHMDEIQKAQNEAED